MFLQERHAEGGRKCELKPTLIHFLPMAELIALAMTQKAKTVMKMLEAG